jgi:hypothetical protein
VGLRMRVMCCRAENESCVVGLRMRAMCCRAENESYVL